LSATNVAVELFQEQESEEVINSFNAVQSWVSGSIIKVRIYYDLNAASISYLCEMIRSDGKEEMVCTGS